MTDFDGSAVDVGAGAAAVRADTEARQRDELARIVSAAEAGEAAAAVDAGGVVEDAGPDNGELAGTVALLVFEVVAVRAGAHWRLSQGEAAAWGRAAGPVLDKYLGRGSLGVEAALLAVSLSLVVPRLLVSRSDSVGDGSAGPAGPAGPVAPGGAVEPQVSALSLVE